MTNDELALRIESLSEKMSEEFSKVHQRLGAVDNDSKIRDEELRSLIILGFEAQEGLRDEMNRRFDETNTKYDEQISVLHAAVHDISRRR